jgi:hypothetical protein
MTDSTALRLLKLQEEFHEQQIPEYFPTQRRSVEEIAEEYGIVLREFLKEES